MGGDLTVESREGAGATFIVSLRGADRDVEVPPPDPSGVGSG